MRDLANILALVFFFIALTFAVFFGLHWCFTPVRPPFEMNVYESRIRPMETKQVYGNWIDVIKIDDTEIVIINGVPIAPLEK